MTQLDTVHSYNAHGAWHIRAQLYLALESTCLQTWLFVCTNLGISLHLQNLCTKNLTLSLCRVGMTCIRISELTKKAAYLHSCKHAAKIHK